MSTVNDTVLSPGKPLLNSDLVVESLLRLRDELYERSGDLTTSSEREIFWKINSCLYRGYKLKE